MRILCLILGFSLFGFAANAQNAQNNCPANASSCVVTATGGTASQSLAERAGQAKSVKDFGALCDGTTNDTVALQAAFTAAGAGTTSLYIPPGTCTHTGLTLDTSVSAAAPIIHGAAAGSSILQLRSGSSSYGIQFIGGQNFGNRAQPVLRDLTLDCNYAGTDCVYAIAGAGMSYPFAPAFRNVTIQRAARDGLSVDGAHAGVLDGVWIAHPGRHGIWFRNTGDWRVTQTQIYGAQRGGPAISAVANNGGGLYRVTTSTAHGLTTGNAVEIVGTHPETATPPAVGQWTVTVINSTQFDLNGSTYASGYTGNGWVYRVTTITGAADNGSGLYRITATGHGYATGDHVYIRNISGATIANGMWVVTVIDANNYDLQNSQVVGVYTSGGTSRKGTAGAFINSPTSNFFENTTWYLNYQALNVTSNSANIFHLRGGEMNYNWTGGVVLNRFTLAPPDSISGVQFTQNSVLAYGVFSDMLLMNTGYTYIGGNQFMFTGGVSKYLIETLAPSGQMNWAVNGFRQDGGAQPWGTAITNDPTLSGVPANRWAVSLGFKPSAGGHGSVAAGYQPSASGQGSFVGGVNGHDKTRIGSFFGSTAFSVGGDNQDIVILPISQVSTNATPVRLSSDKLAAGSANVMNLPFTYQTMLLQGCAAVAQVRSTAERAVWMTLPIGLTRDANNASTALIVGAPFMVTGVQTPSYATAGLVTAALSITVDTTNGGLNVTGTGVAATTVDWHFSCRGIEVG